MWWISGWSKLRETNLNYNEIDENNRKKSQLTVDHLGRRSMKNAARLR